MNEVLSIKEIEAKFDSEWVLIADVQTNERYEILGGNVLFHGKDRAEVYQKVDEFKPKRFTVRWVGERPKNIVLFL